MALPTKIIAGDSKTWTESATVSTERMTHCLRDGDGSGIKILATTDGATHTFTLSPGDSATLKPGYYDVSRVIQYVDGTRATTENIGFIRVAPDPMAERAETENERILKELRKAYSDRVKFGLIESRSVAGLSVSKIAMGELQSHIERYERRVRKERDGGRKARGRESGALLKVKF